ncbi:MAG: GDP-L-fucose synthase [Chlorobiaceae bacterium]|nr:GDP-L-fucose synthase [Chlorobiaceae bacterium]
MTHANRRIFVAGHQGLVGSAIVRRLHQGGYDEILVCDRSELDLLDQKAVFGFLADRKPDYVFMAAAKVGGIMANTTCRAEFIYENLAVETNIIHGCFLAGIRNILFLGSSCIYPKHAPQPMPEACLLTGELEYTNEPYAIAKISGMKLCESYNLQYDTNYLSVMPTNLYGPNDNHDLETSHVLPAMIRKFHLGSCLMADDRDAVKADLDRHPIGGVDGGSTWTEILAVLERHGLSIGPDNVPVVTLWGSGTPRREFLHSDDLADACVFMMEHVRFPDVSMTAGGEVRNTHVNIGTGEDLSIRELADMIIGIIGYQGKVLFDASKPDGTPRKLLDVSRMTRLGWRYGIALDAGIKSICDAYRQGRPDR